MKNTMLRKSFKMLENNFRLNTDTQHLRQPSGLCLPGGALLLLQVIDQKIIAMPPFSYLSSMDLRQQESFDQHSSRLAFQLASPWLACELNDSAEHD